MIFKIQTLEPTVLLVRGYKNPDDIKFSFVCTLHREIGEKKWHILGALTRNGSRKEVKETLQFLTDFPGGTYTYVSQKDFERFYKKHFFVCVDLNKKK